MKDEELTEGSGEEGGEANKVRNANPLRRSDRDSCHPKKCPQLLVRHRCLDN